MLVGFELWVPPISQEYDDGVPIYEILGTDAQIVQFPLRPGRKVMCFSGAMCYMSNDVTMDAKLAGLGKTFGRLVGGGSLFQMTFTNNSQTQKGYIAMTPDYPGVVVPINMSRSGKILAQRDSFLCSTVGLGEESCDVGGAFNPSTSVSGFCCSGIDFLVQSLENGQYAFVVAMGTVVTKVLAAGESILVDTQSILCFESSVRVEVRMVGTGMAACCCAGEGIVNTHMTGPGKIWMQSLSIDKMRTLFPPPTSGGDGDGGGAAAGVLAAL